MTTKTHERDRWTKNYSFTFKTSDRISHTIYLEDGCIYKKSTYPDGEEATKVGDMDIPGGRHFAGGQIYVRFFFTDNILCMHYPDIRKRNCHSIGLKKNDPQGSVMSSNLYTMLAAQHNLEVDQEKQKKDEEKQKKEEERQNKKEENRKENQKDVIIKKLREQNQFFVMDTFRMRRQLKAKEAYINTLPRNKPKCVRHLIKTDFEIQCRDGVIPVHSEVLADSWPWFKMMMEHSCLEKTQQSLKLDYDSDVMEIVVKEMYGEQNEFDLEQAMVLLEITGIYQLPILAAEAYKYIQRSTLDLQQCIAGWKSARLGDHEEAKKYFAKKVYAKTKVGLKTDDKVPEYDDLNREEMMELLFGVML